MSVTIDSVTEWISASAALGTAAFGFVEALKGATPVGTLGTGRLVAGLGVADKALQLAYGNATWRLLSNQFRDGPDAVKGSLRTGLRVGLRLGGAVHILKWLDLPGLDAAQVQSALGDLEMDAGEPSDDEPDPMLVVPDAQALRAREIVGRLELAMDARIDALVCRAYAFQAGVLQSLAGFVAIAAALAVSEAFPDDVPRSQAWLLGLAAVPLAPIANDLVSLIQTARTSLQAKR